MNPLVQHTLVLFEQQQFEEATSALERLLEMNPNDSAGHAMLGLCHHLQGRRPEAVAHARQSLGLSPAMKGFETVARALQRVTGRPVAMPSGVALGVSGVADFGDQGFGQMEGPTYFTASEDEIEALLDRWIETLMPLLPHRKEVWESRFVRGLRACSTGPAQRPVSLSTPRQLPGLSPLSGHSADGRNRFSPDDTDTNGRYSHQ